MQVRRIAASVGLVDLREWMLLRDVQSLHVDVDVDGRTRILVRRGDAEGEHEVRTVVARFELEDAYAPEYVLWRRLEDAVDMLGERDAGTR